MSYLTNKQVETILSEAAPIHINGSSYKIIPDTVGTGNTRPVHNLRVKIVAAKRNPRASSISVAINATTGTIDFDNVKYNSDYKDSEANEMVDNAGGAAMYSFKELLDVYYGATPINIKAFEEKVKEFDKLSKKEKQKYIKMAKGDI